MKTLIKAAFAAAVAIPALLSAYTITVTNPTSSSYWPLWNSETVVWSIPEEESDPDTFLIYWQENKKDRNNNYHSEWIYAAGASGDWTSRNWNVGQYIIHAPFPPYDSARVCVVASEYDGDTLGTGCSAYFRIPY